MKQPLHRLLHLRELLEDLSRVDFESRSAVAHRTETAAIGQRQAAVSLRADAWKLLTAGGSAPREAWAMAIADAEMAGWKEAKLLALLEASRPAVDRAREELLARRVERLQVEILHTAAARAEKKDQSRQDQNRTDDWFQSGPARANRTRR